MKEKFEKLIDDLFDKFPSKEYLLEVKDKFDVINETFDFSTTTIKGIPSGVKSENGEDTFTVTFKAKDVQSLDKTSIIKTKQGEQLSIRSVDLDVFETRYLVTFKGA